MEKLEKPDFTKVIDNNAIENLTDEQMKELEKVLNKMGIHDPLLDIAKQLEEVALADEYFIERKLYPNIDFYSGIILRAIGLPLEMSIATRSSAFWAWA